MTAELSKIKAYLGFAIKSRAIKYGVDDILKLKSAEIILVSDLLAESSLKKILAFAEQKHCSAKVIESNNFEALFDGNKSIKAVAVVDKNLALAIKKIMTNF